MGRTVRRVYVTLYIWSEMGGIEEIVTSLACGLKEMGIEAIVFAWTYRTQGKSQYERRLDACRVRFVAPNSFWGRLAGDWQYRVQVLDRLAGWSLWLLWPITVVISLFKRIPLGEAGHSVRNRVRHWLLKALSAYSAEKYMGWQLNLTHLMWPATLVHQYGTGSPQAMQWARDHHLPVVYSEGNTPGNDARLKTWDSIRAALNRVQQITAPSAGAKDGLVNVLGLPAEKIAVETGPVQFDETPVASPFQSDTERDHAFHILYVGRLDGWKGLTILVQAVHLLTRQGNGVQLTLVGDGAERAALAELVTELELTHRVTFVGRIPHSELPFYYRAADVFAAPSLFFEGLGLVVPEAMSFGLPIVATDIPAFHHLVTPNENGLLVPSGNVDALAEALAWMISHPQQRRLMGQQSRRCFEASGFDLRAFLTRILALYQKVLAETAA